MKVADLLESRQAQWRELDSLCTVGRLSEQEHVAGRDRPIFGPVSRRLPDLALVYAYQLPPETIRYLHQLVARAHNQLYRGEALRFTGWFREILVAVPQRLLADRCVWLAMAIFWGTFLLTAAWPTPRPVSPKKWSRRRCSR